MTTRHGTKSNDGPVDILNVYQGDNPLRRAIEDDQSEGNYKVDKFLWKGDPKATPVQRAGLALFSVLWLALSVMAATGVFYSHDWGIRSMLSVVGAFAAFLGARTFLNAIRRERSRVAEPNRKS